AWPADFPDPAARPATAEEAIAAIRLQTRDTDARRHFQALQNLAGLGIDTPNVARFFLPGAVPQLTIHPRHPGDEAIGVDRAEHRAALGIDLMDLAATMLADPQRSFGPGKPGSPAFARRRDLVQHPAGRGIDLADHRLGDLEQVRPVKRRSG